MKLRIIKYCTKKDLIIIRSFLVIMLCSLIIIGYSVINNIGFALVPHFTKNNPNNLMTTVIIDAGHGGEDGGAVGVDGVVEKGINLDISLKLKDYFKSAGFNVVMVREDDTAVYDESCKTLRQKKVSDIHNREELIKEYPNSIFISIHQNKFQESKYNGTQVFYSKNNDKSKILAQCIQSQIKESLQPENDRMIKPAGSNLYILYHTKVPAIMAECGFLSNPEEAKKLQTNEYQNEIAFAIFSGTIKYVTTDDILDENN